MGRHHSKRNAARTLRYLLRGSTPVNKGLSDGQRRLPQIDNPVLVGVVGVAAVGVGAAIASLRPSRRLGRSGRIHDRIEQLLSGFALPLGTSAEVRAVEVHEGFGKPALIEADIAVSTDTDRHTVSDADLQRLLDAVIRAVWDNPELAPVSVRARIIEAADARLLFDATALGYEAETALPAELYAAYGAPASDPAWRP